MQEAKVIVHADFKGKDDCKYSITVRGDNVEEVVKDIADTIEGLTE